MISNPGEYFKIAANNADGYRWVRRGSIPGYLDETLFSSLHLWSMWKRFGLPHGRGWINESESVIQAITIVDEERTIYDEAKRKKDRDKSGGSRRTTGSRKGRG